MHCILFAVVFFATTDSFLFQPIQHIEAVDEDVNMLITKVAKYRIVIVLYVHNNVLYYKLNND